MRTCNLILPGTRMLSRSNRRGASMCPNNFLVMSVTTKFITPFDLKYFVNKAVIERWMCNFKTVTSKAEKTIPNTILTYFSIPA